MKPVAEKLLQLANSSATTSTASPVLQEVEEVSTDFDNLSLRRQIARLSVRLGSKYVSAPDNERLYLNTAILLCTQAEQTDDETDARRLFNVAKAVERSRKRARK